ncbi:hypothetical protein QQ045_030877 [Rhodiola kirilowii]
MWSDRLKDCNQFLKKWNAKHYGKIRKRVEKLKEELEIVRTEDRSVDKAVREKELADELDDWLAKEEVMWKQRARVKWIKYGDTNTAFFHARASQRRKRNWIRKLKDQGVTVTRDEDIANVIGEYFRRIFSSSLGVEQVN